MKKYKVKIQANSAFPYYMQHRMDDQKLEDWEKKRGRIIERPDVALEDLKRAEFHAYRNAKGKLFIPSEHIRTSLIEAGKLIKSKVGNGKRNMSNIVAAMFYVTPEEILLKDEFEIDKRSAVNNNIKGRIITIRPKWKNWQAEFELIIDNDTITENTIRELLTFSGSYIGIGSFRPQHKGQFGRYILTELKELD